MKGWKKDWRKVWKKASEGQCPFWKNEHPSPGHPSPDSGAVRPEPGGIKEISVRHEGRRKCIQHRAADIVQFVISRDRNPLLSPRRSFPWKGGCHYPGWPGFRFILPCCISQAVYAWHIRFQKFLRAEGIRTGKNQFNETISYSCTYRSAMPFC